MRTNRVGGAAIAALVALAGAAAGCGGGTTVIQGAQPGTQATTTVVASAPPASSPPSAPRSVPPGERSCGGKLAANPHTSCPFARAVYRTVAINNGSAQGTYEVYSSVTGKYYSMACSFERTTRLVCRGGNDAEVSWPG